MNRTLSSVDLHYNNIGPTAAAVLGEALTVTWFTFSFKSAQMNHTLTFLDLGFNDLGDRGVALIGEALKVAGVFCSKNTYVRR